MIREGSTIVLRTNNAIYSPCKVVSISDQNITVTYCAGTKRNRTTGEFQENHPVEIIPRKEIISMSERL